MVWAGEVAGALTTAVVLYGSSGFGDFGGLWL